MAAKTALAPEAPAELLTLKGQIVQREDAALITDKEAMLRDVEDRAVGAKNRYISLKNSLTLYIQVPRRHDDGRYITDDRGGKVYDTLPFKFVNGAYFTDNEDIAELLENHPSYGGDFSPGKEEYTDNARPLFWKGSFPEEIWKALQQERRYVTDDSEAYEG